MSEFSSNKETWCEGVQAYLVIVLTEMIASLRAASIRAAVNNTRREVRKISNKAARSQDS